MVLSRYNGTKHGLMKRGIDVSELTLGAWLRESRQIRDLTLSGIARDAAASNQSNLSKAERNAFVPEPGTMDNLAPYYGSPWLENNRNVLFMRALVWVLTGRPGYRPATDTTLTMTSHVEFALKQADAVVSAWPEAPEDALRVIRGYAVRFPGVPGLVQVPWPETRPFWVWVWLQHGFHVSAGRFRLEHSVKPSVDWDNDEERHGFQIMEHHFRSQQVLLQNWHRWDIARACAASVLECLGDPAHPWYNYPTFKDPDGFPDLSEYMSNIVLVTDSEDDENTGDDFGALVRLLQAEGALDRDDLADGIQNYDALARLFAAFVRQSRQAPALRRIIEQILEMPTDSLPALADFLDYVRKPASTLATTLPALNEFVGKLHADDYSQPARLGDYDLPEGLPF